GLGERENRSLMSSVRFIVIYNGERLLEAGRPVGGVKFRLEIDGGSQRSDAGHARVHPELHGVPESGRVGHRRSREQFFASGLEPGTMKLRTTRNDLLQGRAWAHGPVRQQTNHRRRQSLTGGREFVRSGAGTKEAEAVDCAGASK